MITRRMAIKTTKDVMMTKTNIITMTRREMTRLA